MKTVIAVFCILAMPFVSTAQCFVSGFGSLGQLYNSTGNAVLDAKFRASKVDLENLFGVSTQLYIYDDSASPNAYATVNNNSAYDGLVAFGQNMLVARLWNREKGEAAVAGILAHEFGHVLQIKRGLSQYNSQKRELQADFLAGYYIGYKNFSQSSIQAFGSDLYSIGDYEFASNTHHGTPAERVNAMLAGYGHRFQGIDDAYAASLSYVNGDANPPGPVPPQRKMVLVACTHAAHTAGDMVACTHAAHPSGDVYQCTHACQGPYGIVACHPAGDVGPCRHPLHAHDLTACTHPAHPAGDRVYQ